MSSKFAGVTFDEQAATPSDDAIIRRAILDDGILTGCEFSYTGSTLTMTAGQLMICGRQVKHPSTQNWAVADATTGFARLLLTIDLTRTSSKDTFEQVVDTIEYASAVDGFADLVQDDINASGTKYQIVAAVVSLASGGISGIVSQLAPTSAAIGDKSVIIAKAPTGSTVTCTKGDVVKRAIEKNGEWRFNGLEVGTWTLRAEKAGYKQTVLDVKIKEFGVYRVTLSFANIYGIRRYINNQSPDWERTDDAVGFTATASVGTVAGKSSFDSCEPWSGIKRETLSTGDVMVKIPKFWFQRYREGNLEHIRIADAPAPGFELHPAFNRYNEEKNYIYVGAYKTSSNNKSVTGATPQVSQSIGTMRTNAMSKGSGWSLIDIGAVSAIQMLILTEFANNDVQTVIGYGYGYSHSSPLKTGSCNAVPNLTGSPAGTVRSTDVVWRGIEGFWGNIFEFVDGLFYDNGIYKVCNTPSEYSSSVTDAYTPLSYTVAKGLTNQFIKQEGLDSGANKHVILPEIASGGSGSTFECDICSTAASGVKVPIRGGYYQESPQYGNGLFMCSLDFDTSATNVRVSSRLLYIPEVA